MDVPFGPPPKQLGLSVFDALRAEDEPWLADCYVPPAEFALMVGARARLIFGETSSGKTALRLALEHAWQDEGAKAAWLVVHWHFNVLVGTSEALTGSALAARQQIQVFDAVVARAADAPGPATRSLVRCAALGAHDIGMVH